ncbi:hypothetical protein MPH_03161 [Macrophomina phaseolina MS6]|uniref:ZN622/Rei1/Reh1 zinc finger C2H2-type domain-containing protein n=1 Tax=Macrophomina phaseolina (strain MS6) TaxID=1126212 RepID=K2RX04_MACPH|nr:hypothetical protein MPH_03161 [Macrophomina phaseolina MS6]
MASATAFAFTCSTCSAAFDESHIQQRAHVRDPWHQYNLQRRIASLPPITLQQYESNVQQNQHPSEPRKKQVNEKKSKQHAKRKHAGIDEEQFPPTPLQFDPGHEVDDNGAYALSASPSPSFDLETESDEEEGGESQDPPALLPTTCLFCNAPSPTLTINIAHMSTAHGLFIPEPDRLIDLETFLLYLAALVFRYRECLYCGAAKSSAAAAQTHMRDKGHCMINLADAECELLDFWEFDEEDEQGADGAASPAGGRTGGVSVSDTEMRLPSGAIVGSRHHAESVHSRHGLVGVRAQAARRRKAIADGERQAAVDGEDPDNRPQPESTERRVAVRGEMGLVGVSEQQRRTLVAVEKRMMKREAVARAAQRWATEKVANRQKFFKPDVPGRKNG